MRRITLAPLRPRSHKVHSVVLLPLDIGDVDFERGVLVVDDEERRLRPLELRLLAYLSERPDVVLSPEDLLRDVWGYADGVETRTLYATINRLRLALERDPKSPAHILTVPRVGYRFRPSTRATVRSSPRGAPARPVSPLPVALGPIVARDADLTRLAALVADRPLVVLRGAAGVGKSRLALELARRQPEGAVVWCGLATAKTVDDVHRGVATSLGLGPSPGGPAAAIRLALAARRDSLLILDDADLAPLAEPLADWLAAAAPRILVTSRASLAFPGEAQLVLGPLPDTVEGSGALLEARLRERQPDAPFDPAAPWLPPLLRALGGLPLAIELAAPWLTVMSGEELLDHVRRGLGVLREPVRSGGPARHTSLTDALRWSWPLLDSAARSALVQCAVFEGRFDLRAAREVVRIEGGVPLHHVLLGLVERSWLRVEAGPLGQQFTFYAGQREFLAGEAGPGQLDAARARHVAFHAGLLTGQDIEAMYLVGGPDWQRLQARAADLRAALGRARGPAVIPLGLALGRVLLAEGPLEECVAVLARGIAEASRTGSPAERAALERCRAIALRHLGRREEAREALAGALGRAGDAPRERGRIFRALGVLELYHGDPGVARRHLEEGLAASREAGEAMDVAVTLAELGTLELLQGDPGRAASLVERALGPLRAAGASGVYGVYLVNLGVMELVAGRVESARGHLTDALALHRRLGNARFEALALGNLALVEERRGDHAAAHAHLDEGLALAVATGDPGEEGACWSSRGLVHLSEGRVDAAAAALERAAALAAAVPIPRLEAEVLARRARVSVARGEWAHAERMIAGALAITTRLGLPTERDEALRAEAELRTRRAAEG